MHVLEETYARNLIGKSGVSSIVMWKLLQVWSYTRGLTQSQNNFHFKKSIVHQSKSMLFFKYCIMKNSPKMLKTPEWKNLAKPKLLDTRLKYFLPWCDQQNILHKAIIEVQLNQQSKKPRHKSIKVASHVWIGNFELHTYIHWHKFSHWNMKL